MKRYLIFAGSFYYPSGGWEDYVGTKDDLDAAIELAKEKEPDWYHIVDTDTGLIVKKEDLLHKK